MLPKFDRQANLRSVQDAGNKNLTIAMFKETNDGRTPNLPLWSIKEWKEVYLHYSDPTEYAPAMHLIGDWNHWKAITKSWGCNPHILEWREEVKIKLRSEAILALIKQSKGDKGTAAAKWLAEKGYDGKMPKVTQKDIEEAPNALIEHSKRMGIVNA